MKTSLRRIWTSLFAICVLSTPALAQEEPGSETAGDAGVPEASTETASDAKRVVRIRQVIELDKQHLRWLRSELNSQTRWFERLAAGMGEVAQERNEKRELLEFEEGLAKNDADQIANLERVLEIFAARLEKYREADTAVEKIQLRERGNREIARIIGERKESSEARRAYIETLVERLAHLIPKTFSTGPKSAGRES